MKQRVEEMEREAKKLRELQAAAEANSGAEDGEGTTEGGDDESGATDNRSVYVGNVCDNLGSLGHKLTWSRLTTVQRQKKSKHIFKHVV